MFRCDVFDASESAVYHIFHGYFHRFNFFQCAVLKRREKRIPVERGCFVRPHNLRRFHVCTFISLRKRKKRERERERRESDDTFFAILRSRKKGKAKKREREREKWRKEEKSIYFVQRNNNPRRRSWSIFPPLEPVLSFEGLKCVSRVAI